MQRRTFLTALAIPFVKTYGQAPSKVNRSEHAVRALRVIDQDRRDALVRNVQGKSPSELNSLIPEISDIEVLNGASQRSGRKSLRLIAWNTERGRYWREGARLITETPALSDPDIIFLGEMDLGMARSSNEHTTREMAAALKMNYAYGVEFLELTGGELQERIDYPGKNRVGYHGNAILSKYPLQDVRLLRFPGIEKWYAGKEYGASESEQVQKRLGGRMALLATINPGRKITVVSTHLESSLRDKMTRNEQMAILLDDVQKYSVDSPVIIGGDLNGAPDEPLFEHVKQFGFRLEDTNDTRGGTVQRMKDNKVVIADRYIDYLLVKGLKTIRNDTSPRVIPAVYPSGENGKLLSDHAIVTASVVLNT